MARKMDKETVMTSCSESRRSTFALAALGLVVALGTLASCGGGDGGGSTTPPPTPPSYTASPTAPAANLVTMIGSVGSNNTLELIVNLTGPTTANNIYGFAFDLLLSDPSLVAVNGASAGNALSDGPSGKAATAALNGNRITVGVSKLGDDAGNAATTGTSTVVRITLRTLKQGSSTVRFVGSTPSTSHADAAALDPNQARIPTIQFDAASGTIAQN